MILGFGSFEPRDARPPGLNPNRRKDQDPRQARSRLHAGKMVKDRVQG